MPGKLILLGEHAVVYRRPALVAAVDLRLTAVLRPGPAPSPGDEATVRLSVPPLGLDDELPWSVVCAHARHARERWRRWADGDGPPPSGDLDPAHVVKVALGEAALAVGDEMPPSLDLTVRSELPIGCGFGSSAAAAVALVAGYLAWRGVEPEPARVEPLALEVERRQHGTPSGVDGATVLHGGALWAERDDAGELRFEPFAGRSPVLHRLTAFDTGRPPESTGAVVARVRRRGEREPERFAGLWDEIEAATRGFRHLLESGGDEPERARELIVRCQRALEAIGVVPEAVRRRVREVEDAGGAAKISGAGSLAGPGAGMLIVHHPEPERLFELPALADLRHHPVVFGAPGLRVERESAPHGDRDDPSPTGPGAGRSRPRRGTA